MNGEPNIADLLRQLRDDTTELVREEVALAKTEIGEKVSRTSKNVGYLAAGALVALCALLLLLTSFSYLLTEMFLRQDMNPGMAAFLGFFIVAVVVGIVGSILISKAVKTLGNESVKPNRTVQSLREDKQWAQNKMS